MFRDTDGGAGQGKVWSMSSNEKETPGAFAYERASPPAPQGGGGGEGSHGPASCRLPALPRGLSQHVITMPEHLHQPLEAAAEEKKNETELDGLWVIGVPWPSGPCICRIPHGYLWALDRAPLMSSGLQLLD